ncbi:Glycosyltransferase involved in cell wall bisynthesis [Lachnospiraceae bacterium G41]|nr:Glycosyltransferase involved in cell wall bisynthesis [Lachnospiraceae bacterium G41]
MKKISILIPCFNEEKNVEPMVSTIIKIMEQYSGKYFYEVILRDNASIDNTLNVMRELAQKNKNIKVIANARNYGTNTKKDSFCGRVSGDVVISIACDFQDPPELIPDFISWWEKGYEAVCGKKIASKEGFIKYGLRQIFYSIIENFSDTPQYSNISGIVLMSRRLYDLSTKYNDSYFRYFIADIGYEVKFIEYEQQKRKSGKSSYNIWRYLSFAIDSLVSVSTAPLRLASVLGFISSFGCLIIGFIYLIYKLIFWDSFVVGTAPMVIGMFFLGSVLLFFIGVVGEYVGIILKTVTKQAPPIVKELINFEDIDNDPYLFKIPDAIDDK